MLTVDQRLLDIISRDPHLLDNLDRADCADSLLDYARLMWPIVEPVRPFVLGWIIEAIADHLTAVTKGQLLNCLINVPPGFMKSLMTSVFWPSWEWGPQLRPELRYVCFSYSAHLTIRDNIKCRNIIQSPLYRRLWPHVVLDELGKTKFSNTKTGFKFATSVGGVGTGERGDRLILDDPHSIKNVESDQIRESTIQFFSEVLPSRTNESESDRPDRNSNPSATIVIMQRTHEKDVSGYILSEQLDYEHLCIPMKYEPQRYVFSEERPEEFIKPSTINFVDPRTVEGELAFPERFGEKAVTKLEKTLGEYATAGQLQQRPSPRGGGSVKAEWFELINAMDVPDTGMVMARGWDFASSSKEKLKRKKTAHKSAGSANVLTGFHQATKTLYILHAWWDQLNPGQLMSHIKLTLENDRGRSILQSMPQDPGQAGVFQVTDLMSLLMGHDFVFSPESGDKEDRFRPFIAQAQTRFSLGQSIKLVKGGWNKVYLEQITKFPTGAHKDIPDAQSRSLYEVSRRTLLDTNDVGGSIVIEGNGKGNEPWQKIHY